MTIIIFTIIAVTPFVCMKEADKLIYQLSLTNYKIKLLPISYTVTMLIEVTRQLLSEVTENPVFLHRVFSL